MRFAKLIRRVIAHDENGVHVRGGVNAVVAANVNEPGTSTTTVRSESHVVQDSRTRADRPSTQQEKADG